MERTEERKVKFYRCGRCETDIEYPKNEEPPVPCPDCGWWGIEKKYKKLPPEIKIDLNRY